MLWRVRRPTMPANIFRRRRCELLTQEALRAKMQGMDAAMAKLHVTPPEGADAVGPETFVEGVWLPRPQPLYTCGCSSGSHGD